MRIRTWMFVAGVGVGMGMWAGAAGAQTVPDYGFEWARIGDPGNPAFDGGGMPFLVGRGRVDYEYRISTLEVTTGQWMEYVNHFSTREGGTFFSNPLNWGAEWDPTYSGPGVRWRLKNVPSAPMLPVGGISWREAAMYANWLHNGKVPELWAIQDGAYDAGTFSTNPNRTFNDQLTRNPEARFWIPGLDEWLKAVHYDPDRHGPGEGGWWLYPNSSDEPLEPGPPGVGQTTAEWRDPAVPWGEWLVPLGAYPDEASPWGLLDASGGAHEWTEDHMERTWRFLNGNNAGSGHPLLDHAGVPGTDTPSVRGSNGLRIASAIPSPATSALLVAAFALILKRRRESP